MALRSKKTVAGMVLGWWALTGAVSAFEGQYQGLCQGPPEAIQALKRSTDPASAIRALYERMEAALEREAPDQALETYRCLASEGLEPTREQMPYFQTLLAQAYLQKHWHYLRAHGGAASPWRVKALMMKDEAQAGFQRLGRSTRRFDRVSRQIEGARAERLWSAEEILAMLRESRTRNPTQVPKLPDLPVNFEFDSAALTPEGIAQARELGEALARVLGEADYRVIVIGHTDVRGTELYNLALSERRAATVASWLERHFPSLRGRLETQGRGESEPKAFGNDEEAHRINRRVEVRLVNAK